MSATFVYHRSLLISAVLDVASVGAFDFGIKVQILSHQNKIATQIELFVGDGDNYESAHFKRLGYLSLNGNVESNYQARELKSVYVNAPGQFLRILVHKCYINEHNFFNQVRYFRRTPAVSSPSMQSRENETGGELENSESALVHGVSHPLYRKCRYRVHLSNSRTSALYFLIYASSMTTRHDFSFHLV